MKPFSMEFVIRETLRHMQDSVSISTQKTLARMPEFEGRSEMVEEVLRTLASLNRLNTLIEDIKINNIHLLNKDKEYK